MLRQLFHILSKVVDLFFQFSCIIALKVESKVFLSEISKSKVRSNNQPTRNCLEPVQKEEKAKVEDKNCKQSRFCDDKKRRFRADFGTELLQEKSGKIKHRLLK